MEAGGKRVAILAEDMYEDPELWYPYYRLLEAGAEVALVGPEAGATYQSKHGYPVETDVAAADVRGTDFDAVIVPGGFSPDRMRRSEAMVRFLREAHEAGKVVAAICHGPWMLISAGAVKGRRVTGFIAIKDDLVNAGATYVDEDVVRDGHVITSRTPKDLPAFSRAILAALAEG